MNSSAIPCLRYRDAATAIDWLCHAFGFEAQLVVPDGSGGIAHAQLVLGGGMVMLGSARDDAHGHFGYPPGVAASAWAPGVYLVVDDADIVCARAQAAGATIVLPAQDQDYGGRGFTCLDLEGQVWSIGSYDPWAESKR